MHTTHDIRRKLNMDPDAWEMNVSVKGKDVVLKYCEPIGKDSRITDILAERIVSRQKE